SVEHLHIVRVSFFIFFFQAEDGIRDSSVTGVQTCALPIFFSFEGFRFPSTSAATLNTVPTRAMVQGDFSQWKTLAGALIPIYDRSEERRVGKECRSRWWGESWRRIIHKESGKI